MTGNFLLLNMFIYLFIYFCADSTALWRTTQNAQVQGGDTNIQKADVQIDQIF